MRSTVAVGIGIPDRDPLGHGETAGIDESFALVRTSERVAF